MSQLNAAIPTFIRQIIRLTSFTQIKLFRIIFLIVACFFFFQELIMYKKTKKVFHKMFTLFFISIIVFWIIFIIHWAASWRPRSMQSLLAGFIMFICFGSAIYFLVRATKLKRNNLRH